jgi:hypothetical protein
MNEKKKVKHNEEQGEKNAANKQRAYEIISSYIS